MGRALLYIFVASNAFWTLLIVAKLVDGKDNLAVSANNFISYIITTQVAAKAYQLQVHSRRLAVLLDILCEEFWPPGEVEVRARHHDQRHRDILRSITTYRIILIICITIIFSTPLLAGERLLPLEMWFFNREYILHATPVYELIYTAQCLSTAVSYVLGLVPFDMLFIALVGCAEVQLDMLRCKLEALAQQDQDDFEELTKIVQHHNLVLKFLKDVDVYFTRPLLKQYVDAICCMGIYIYLEQQDFQ